ncbi:MAG: uroporphyrinogen-III C-methyltransferase [Gemmataceae bacterium]
MALVGAGPGHPGHITVRAVEWLRRADVVLHDRLVAPALIDHAPASARRICVEELGPCHAQRLPLILDTMIDLARQGLCVVRLKGGDPMIFARGGEEALALREAGIPFEIVPGVTAALSASACAAIPLTHRLHSSAVAIITGHEYPEKASSRLDWDALARFPGTLVFYMGIARLEHLTASLMQHGKPGRTPAAVVERAGTSSQRTVTGALADIAGRVREQDLHPPALLILGEVVSLRDTLRWFEDRPLFGKTVLVTRPRHQAGEMVRRIEELGGTGLVLPGVEIGPAPDPARVDDAIARLASFDWLVFTSGNGVSAFLDRLVKNGRDLRDLAGLQLAAIGPATATALQRHHLRADLVPAVFNSESLAESLRSRVAGQRVLLARADRGLDLLREELSRVASVEQVAVYSQRNADGEDTGIVHQRIRDGELDAITLTSSNIARKILGDLDEACRRRIESGQVGLISISPRTSAAAAEWGLPVAAEARHYTIDGVVEALCEWLRRRESDSMKSVERQG